LTDKFAGFRDIAPLFFHHILQNDNARATKQVAGFYKKWLGMDFSRSLMKTYRSSQKSVPSLNSKPRSHETAYGAYVSQVLSIIAVL